MWYYLRNFNGKACLIFQCEAEGILQADALYKEATGTDPSKDKNVSLTKDGWFKKPYWDC